MVNFNLNIGSLPYFITFYISDDPQRILQLSLISRSFASSTAFTQKLQHVELVIAPTSFGNLGGETVMEFIISSKTEKKISRFRTGTTEECLVTMLAACRLFPPTVDFKLSLTSVKSQLWFTAAVSKRISRALKKLFPYANLFLNIDQKFNQTSDNHLYFFVCDLLPIAKHVHCQTRDLRWFDGCELELLNITNASDCKQIYIPRLLSVKTKEIRCENGLQIHMFRDAGFLAQRETEVLCCDLDLGIEPVAWPFYSHVFQEIGQCLPKLRLIKINQCVIKTPTTSGNHYYSTDCAISEDFERALIRAAWHIREIIKYSHVKTHISISLVVNDLIYFNASVKLFSLLLPRIRLFDYEYDEMEDQLLKQLYYDDDNVRINLVIALPS